NKGTHDVVYVATEHNSIYAFDAHTKQPALWQVSFLSSGVTSVPAPDTAESTILPEIGITGTPAIDVATNTLYVVAETKNTAGPEVRLLHDARRQRGGHLAIGRRHRGRRGQQPLRRDGQRHVQRHDDRRPRPLRERAQAQRRGQARRLVRAP